MPRLAIIDNEKIKHISEKEHIKSLCPVNRTGGECMYFEGEKLLIDEVLCTGCGICAKAAPNAIQIINLPETSNKPPIHQYGKNGFRIFDLPILQDSSVTGILGRNGIGKSTIINVLSNTLKANFGDAQKNDDLSQEDYFKLLLERFKGTALQNYFTKLQKGDIKVSYKPQQIINIPTMFKGKVSELLLRVNQNESSVKEVTQKLNVSQVLDREIEVLSGGELQRVAIAASLLKEDASLFVFDEITNYLDIYERLNSSKYIKEKTSGKTSVVVEHDLVVLDYLADFMNLVYGTPGAYSMMTGVKAAKVGINIYLDGYSKEENVRFREKAISFDKESAEESKHFHVVASWENSTIKRGNFELHVEAGDLKKGEVLGIIGKNALGKSTFVKHIAEVGFGDEIVISYKEQLIQRSDNLVMEELMVFSNYTDNFYQLYVLDPLRIKELEEKRVSSLSGGELQRYALAKCLLADAQIYLLDEPTAFLDIEDRLKIAKMIKNFIQLKEKSAVIIDHDLVFMDYLSDRLQVFQGEPSLKGHALTPKQMREGMNTFLKNLNITFRRDESNKRPRVNKEGSMKDQEQKRKGEYYYA